MPRGIDTRTRLLDAALEAFAADGYAGASIRQITRAVDVRESAFYAHFPSKRAVWDALVSEGGPAVVLRELGAADADASPGDVLAAIAEGALAAWSTRRARAIAAIVLRDASGSGDELRLLLTQVDDALLRLAALFVRWRTAGRIHAAAESETLAFEFMAPIVMARLFYFHLQADDAAAMRGRALIAAHVASFSALIAR